MNSNFQPSKLVHLKKARTLVKRKACKIEVNPQSRRLGESERARDHNMSYQALPLACINVLG
uniref:Uncharacterized protein n=1 Tax=Helianthus annuus TaxID=4232 RepID=A0A251U0Y7_HELAN